MYVTIGEEQYQFGEVEIYTSGEPISNFVVGFPFSMDVDNITTLVTCNSGSYDYSFASDSNGAISLCFATPMAEHSVFVRLETSNKSLPDTSMEELYVEPTKTR